MNIQECLDQILSANELPEKLGDLLIKSCLEKDLDGLVLEFGVAGGESLQTIANSTDKICYGFDSFRGLPEDSPGWEKGTFNLNGVVPVFTQPNIQIVEGLIQETLQPFLDSHPEKVFFIHIDTDIYSSAKYILDTLYDNNRFQSGSIILFDEIFDCENHAYPDFQYNEYKAFLEFGERTKTQIKFLGRRDTNSYAFEILA